MKFKKEGVLWSAKDSRGFILMISYMLMAVLSIFSLGLFSRGSVFIQSAERNAKRIIAFNAAEAGFDDAFFRIKNNRISSYPWKSGYTGVNTKGIPSGYSVTVTDMGNNIKQIAVTGYSPAEVVVDQSQEVRSVTGYVQSQPSAAFNFSVFAKNSLHMSGNAFVDSYDSSLGPYGATVGGSVNAGSKGDLGTDSIAAGTVMMSGNVKVKGGVTVGPQGNPNAVITTSGHVVITGEKTAAVKAQNPPAATTSASSEGALTISGNTVYYLPAGSHHFSSLSITGNGQIVPLGPVAVYVDGETHISGNGIATVKNLPPNFLLYSLSDKPVKLSGNGNFFGAIYAPHSEVQNTGNGKIFGAIVSTAYHQSGNGELHFDEALKNVGGTGGSGLSVLSWQEHNITAQSASSGAANVSGGTAKDSKSCSLK